MQPVVVISLALALTFSPAVAADQGVRRTADKEQTVGVAPSGRLQGDDVIVRRQARKQERKPGLSYDDDLFRTDSAFAGTVEVVEYKAHENMSCSSGNGGAEIDMDSPAPRRMAISECKSYCQADDRCTCISFDTTTGKCSKHKFCVTEECTPSSLIHTYELVADYTVGGVSYRRAGGWTCKAAPDVLEIDAQPILNVTPTQCLERCNNDAQCSCVRYERYYTMACWKQRGCPWGADLHKCDRSDRHDTYIRHPQ